jgi:hypothetical protein
MILLNHWDLCSNGNIAQYRLVWTTVKDLESCSYVQHSTVKFMRYIRHCLSIKINFTKT